MLEFPRRSSRSRSNSRNNSPINEISIKEKPQKRRKMKIGKSKMSKTLETLSQMAADSDRKNIFGYAPSIDQQIGGLKHVKLQTLISGTSQRSIDDEAVIGKTSIGKSPYSGSSIKINAFDCFHKVLNDCVYGYSFSVADAAIILKQLTPDIIKAIVPLINQQVIKDSPKKNTDLLDTERVNQDDLDASIDMEVSQINIKQGDTMISDTLKRPDAGKPTRMLSPNSNSCSPVSAAVQALISFSSAPDSATSSSVSNFLDMTVEKLSTLEQQNDNREKGVSTTTVLSSNVQASRSDVLNSSNIDATRSRMSKIDPEKDSSQVAMPHQFLKDNMLSGDDLVSNQSWLNQLVNSKSTFLPVSKGRVENPMQTSKLISAQNIVLPKAVKACERDEVFDLRHDHTHLEQATPESQTATFFNQPEPCEAISAILPTMVNASTDPSSFPLVATESTALHQHVAIQPVSAAPAPIPIATAFSGNIFKKSPCTSAIPSSLGPTHSNNMHDDNLPNINLMLSQAYNCSITDTGYSLGSPFPAQLPASPMALGSLPVPDTQQFDQAFTQACSQITTIPDNIISSSTNSKPQPSQPVPLRTILPKPMTEAINVNIPLSILSASDVTQTLVSQLSPHIKVEIGSKGNIPTLSVPPNQIFRKIAPAAPVLCAPESALHAPLSSTSHTVYSIPTIPMSMSSAPLTINTAPSINSHHQQNEPQNSPSVSLPLGYNSSVNPLWFAATRMQVCAEQEKLTEGPHMFQLGMHKDESKDDSDDLLDLASAHVDDSPAISPIVNPVPRPIKQVKQQSGNLEVASALLSMGAEKKRRLSRLLPDPNSSAKVEDDAESAYVDPEIYTVEDVQIDPTKNKIGKGIVRYFHHFNSIFYENSCHIR